MKILTFLLNQGKYAVEVDLVSTIENFNHISKIPNSKATVIGLIRSREDVIPVIDTNLFLNGEKIGKNFKKFIIINIKEEKLALAVDDVAEVIEVETSNIELVEKANNISVIKTDCGLITLLSKNNL